MASTLNTPESKGWLALLAAIMMLGPWATETDLQEDVTWTCTYYKAADYYSPICEKGCTEEEAC